MRKILTILALSALTISSQAKVKLPHIICDNMVLQQQTDVYCGVTAIITQIIIFQ